MKKILLTVICTVLACSLIAGATYAWLFDKTNEIENTFTVGLVDIELTETTGTEYKMIPGTTITKDPKVTVKAKSENCYVFVHISETDNGNAISYNIAEGWKVLNAENYPGVYYRTHEYNTSDVEYVVFAGNAITVSENVVNGAAGATLSVTALAIQSAGSDNASAAWSKLSAAVQNANQ